MVLGAHLMHLVLFVGLLVHLLFKVEHASFLGLHKSGIQMTTLVENLTDCLLRSTRRLSISEAHKGHACLRHHLHVVDVAKLREEVSELVLGGRRLNILDDQIQEHHRLFPLIGLFGDLNLPLLLGLGLTDEQASLQLFS